MQNPYKSLICRDFFYHTILYLGDQCKYRVNVKSMWSKKKARKLMYLKKRTVYLLSLINMAF